MSTEHETRPLDVIEVTTRGLSRLTRRVLALLYEAEAELVEVNAALEETTREHAPKTRGGLRVRPRRPRRWLN